MKIWQKYTIWYSVLTLLYLFPLVRNFSGLAGHGDAWQFVWNIWWVKYAWAHDASIWFTDMLHWPNGIPMILQTFTLTSTIPATLLSYVIGIVPAYNVMIVFHTILSGVAMYLLCYHVSQRHAASFVGGVLFAFSPFRLVHYYGHLHLLTTWVLPLAILFLLRTLEGKKWSWVGAVTFCVLTAYADLYYFLFLFVVSVALVLWYRPNTRVILLRLLLVVIVTGIFVAPYLIPFIKATTMPDFQVPGHVPILNTNSFSDLAFPGGRSLYQNLTARFWEHEPGWRENGSYLGWSVVLLLVFSFPFLWRSHRRVAGFWGILGALFLALTFWTPYAWLEDLIPFLKIAGVPLRFFAVTLVSLCILVALALAKRSRGFIFVFLVLLMVEYLPAPLEVSSVEASPFYTTLRNDPERYAILDISDAPAKVLYYQTIHQKPIIGGYTTRPTVSTDQFLEKTPIIADIILRYPISAFSKKYGFNTLQDFDIRYVLISPRDVDSERYLKQLGATLEYTDATLGAFRIAQPTERN